MCCFFIEEIRYASERFLFVLLIVGILFPFTSNVSYYRYWSNWEYIYVNEKWLVYTINIYEIIFTPDISYISLRLGNFLYSVQFFS